MYQCGREPRCLSQSSGNSPNGRRAGRPARSRSSPWPSSSGTCVARLTQSPCQSSSPCAAGRRTTPPLLRASGIARHSKSASCQRRTGERGKTDLHRRRRRRRSGGARGVRREVGSALPGDHAGVAERLGVRDPFLAFPDEVRRVIYTTNAIEALNRQLRKAIKTKGHFPNEEAAKKLIYLAIVNAVPAWTRTRNWTTALLACKIHFGDRLPE